MSLKQLFEIKTDPVSNNSDNVEMISISEFDILMSWILSHLATAHVENQSLRSTHELFFLLKEKKKIQIEINT